MGRRYGAAKRPPVAQPATGGLPAHYAPVVAGYAKGPWLEPELVTPTNWRWRNARTFIVRHSDGLDYRAVRVENDGGKFLGYWAVELMGTALTLGEEFDAEHEEATARARANEAAGERYR